MSLKPLLPGLAIDEDQDAVLVNPDVLLPLFDLQPTPGNLAFLRDAIVTVVKRLNGGHAPELLDLYTICEEDGPEGGAGAGEGRGR